MFKLVFDNKYINKEAIVSGLFSGDGSPALQNKSCITHHIAIDKNHLEFESRFIKALFNKNIVVKNLGNSKIVVYSNWNDNLNLLLGDCYKFNLKNRLKFAHFFLNLESTKIFANLRDGDIVKGIDIARYNLKPLLKFKNRGYIVLNLISPKPNKKYELFLTDLGLNIQNKIRNFASEQYISYKNDFDNFNKNLEKFNL